MKLLIADDEPLIQVGISSMLDWKSSNIEICGIAKNGMEAFALIQEKTPDIVISDIKMPCMSGLELLEKCHQEGSGLPVFILLTNFENFDYARMALKYEACDYLVKIELNKENLAAAIKKAQGQVTEIKEKQGIRIQQETELSVFQNRFYIRLLNDLFDSREMIFEQAKDFHIEFCSASYVVASIKIIPCDSAQYQGKNAFSLYNSTVQMFEQLIDRYLPCYVLSLDLACFAAIFHLSDNSVADFSSVEQALNQTSMLIHNYYNVRLHTGIGRFVTHPDSISQSYNDAKQIAVFATDENPIVTVQSCDELSRNVKNIINLSLFKEEIVKTFESYDMQALNCISQTIHELFVSDTIHLVQAVDIVGSMLHFAITLLPNGTELVETIFQDEPDNYLSLYHYRSVPQVLSYLARLTVGLCEFFNQKHLTPKTQLMLEVKQFLDEHICERLSLQSIADHFNISQNYLSQMFKQYHKIGFNEYINRQKVAYAKHILSCGDVKIYEVANQLGFENAFYFSKVFKKVCGRSPTEYLTSISQSPQNRYEFDDDSAK